MDMAAAKLGLDAKDIRLRNLVADDELPYKVASGIVWDKSGFHECLHNACAAIGYDELAPSRKRRAPPAAGSASASPAMPSSPASARASRLHRACRSIPAPKPRSCASIRPAPSPPRSASLRTARAWKRHSPRSSPNISVPVSRTSASCRATALACPAAPAPMPAAAWCWPAARRPLPPKGARKSSQCRVASSRSVGCRSGGG